MYSWAWAELRRHPELEGVSYNSDEKDYTQEILDAMRRELAK